MRVGVAVASARGGAADVDFPVVYQVGARFNFAAGNVTCAAVLKNKQVTFSLVFSAFKSRSKCKRLSGTHQSIKAFAFWQGKGVCLVCFKHHDFFQDGQAFVKADKHARAVL